jgi:hypothetical protein
MHKNHSFIHIYMFSNVIFSIVINIFISLLFIYGIHLCWNYLKDTYSTKKTRDLVNTQVQKYKMMVDEIQQSKQVTGSQLNALTDQEKQAMDDELTAFMHSM